MVCDSRVEALLMLIHGVLALVWHVFLVPQGACMYDITESGSSWLTSGLQLYISEACWAFLFGVIVGEHIRPCIFSWWLFLKASIRTILRRHLQSTVMGSRRGGNQRYYTRIQSRHSGGRRVCYRGGTAKGVHETALEEPLLSARSGYDMGACYPVESCSYLTFSQGWLVSAAFIYALIPGLNFLTSLAVAACLTPTDPILAAAVIGGKWADKHVPAHIRHLLAAESGCNDGAAFPFLFLSLYLLLDHPNTGVAIRDWFLLLWLCESHSMFQSSSH